MRVSIRRFGLGALLTLFVVGSAEAQPAAPAKVTGAAPATKTTGAAPAAAAPTVTPTATTPAPTTTGAAPPAPTTTGAAPPAPTATGAAPPAPATSTPKSTDDKDKDEDEDGGTDSAAKPEKVRPTAIQSKILTNMEAAKLQGERVEALRRRGMLSDKEGAGLTQQINSMLVLLASLKERAQLNVKEKKSDVKELRKAAEDDEEPLKADVVSAVTSIQGIKAQLDEKESLSGWPLVEMLLRARCSTAICFDNGDKKDWLGIEPLVELPIGKSFSLSSTAIGDYTNNHDIKIDLAAGVRVWIFRDIVSLSVYISKPLTDARVRLTGSSFVYPASSVRRPYPGIALGALFDTIWLGFDRDELRNGDGQDPLARNPAFPPNHVVSSAWTLTVSLQPVTAFRTAIGTGVQATRKDGSK